MDYTRLGKTGLKVSRICLGTMTYGDPAWRPWILSEERGRPFIKRALEHGITFFDTADMYSLGRSEEVLGRALRDFTTRDQVVIATKAYYEMSDDPNDRGLSRKHLMASIDGSLRPSAPTSSISTRSTAGTRRRRSRKRCARSTTSSA